MNIADFKKLPILGILRGIKADIVKPLTDTIVSSGLKTVEITMNTPGAGGIISSMKKAASNKLTIGAGTVLALDDAKKALDAGASFIVMPVLIKDVAEYCAKNKIPFFPGALTPQEIYDAWRSGACMVKVFPAKFFGPSYFKEIKGPLSDIELLACGGVNAGNICSFFDMGASAIAFGASIFKEEWLGQRNFSAIEAAIKNLVGVLKEQCTYTEKIQYRNA